jgi:lysozyme
MVTNLLIRQLMKMEGLRLEAYRDAAGVVTIGYGHTKGVLMGDRITKYWAKDLLMRDVAEVERQVAALDVARTEGQMDALVSFAFNVGIGRLRTSNLLRVIRQGGSKSAIRHEFMKWTHTGGKKLKGLERRRDWEAKRFFESSLPTDMEIIDRV